MFFRYINVISSEWLNFVIFAVLAGFLAFEVNDYL